MFIALFFILLFLLFLSSQQLTRSLTLLFQRLFRSHTFSIRLLAFLFLPGVIIHELSHAFMAMLLFVPVGQMEFLPVVHDSGHVKLGSVQIGKTDPIRRALIGLAPVLFGSTLIILLLYVFVPKDFALDQLPWWGIGALLYGVFVISNTMFSSRKDLEGTLEVGIMLFIISVILYITGIRIPEVVLDFLFSTRIESVFQLGSLLLGIPLILDGLVILLMRVVLRGH